MRAALIIVLCCLGCLAAAAADDDPVELPYRRGPIELDGRLDDWRGPRLEVHLDEPEVPAPLANSGTFFLVWDEDHLWFAADIADAEVYPAPPGESGSSLYHWDSIEIYVDGRGDRNPRMNEDDNQLIVGCDGRNAVMQGDELLRTVEAWVVPKRERPGLGVRTAARRTATGYVVEGAFPLAAAGVAEARAGQTLGLDVAWNDWTEDHPRLPELLKDLENLALLADRRSEAEVAIVDPDSLGWDGLLVWEARAYRAWSWCNGRDFGHPATWRLARLVGGPSLGERLAGRWGVPRLLGSVLAVVLAVAMLGDLFLRRRQRRRIRELLARVEELSSSGGPAAPAPVAEAVDLPLGAPPELPAAPPELATRLLDHIRDHLAEPLNVGELADALGVSVRTLQRECRLGLGASPREVILAVKMRAAHDLLATGRWRVGEVAEQVGFDSPYHFSRRYKDFHGEPPSAAIPARPEPADPSEIA
ncbi:MAG: helix-turn-helix domain-containing protein [Candidatus Krumholzibacteriia bacterium]